MKNRNIDNPKSCQVPTQSSSRTGRWAPLPAEEAQSSYAANLRKLKDEFPDIEECIIEDIYGHFKDDFASARKQLCLLSAEKDQEELLRNMPPLGQDACSGEKKSQTLELELLEKFDQHVREFCRQQDRQRGASGSNNGKSGSPSTWQASDADYGCPDLPCVIDKKQAR